MIKFANPLAEYNALKIDIDQAIARVLESGNYILGNEVENFEYRYAEYVSSRFCIGVANGLDALTLCLQAIDIGEGDEVIVPAHTFFATWLAVLRLGAKPVGVNVDTDTYTIAPKGIGEKITKKTRAIIPVHLYGNVCDMNAISELATKNGLYIIEDAAQAHGASYESKRVGSIGHMTAWSFYPTKNLGCFGDGGAITTNDANLDRKIRSLRNYGSSKKYSHELIGCNSRLDEIQAAILNIKLNHLNEWNAKRKKSAMIYEKTLDSDLVVVPKFIKNQEQVWHLYVISSNHRDALKVHLDKNKIPTMIHYPVPPYRQASIKEKLINTDKFLKEDCLSNTILSLPMHPFLTECEMKTICDAVNSFRY